MANSEPTVDALSSNELQSLHDVEAAPSGDPPLRFVQRCQDWFEAWIDANKHPLETNAVAASQILIFIFAEAPDIERPRYIGIGTEWKRFFHGAHAQDTQGVILSNENFRKIYRISPSINSSNDAFELIADHLKDEDTFVVAQFSQRRLLYHLPGGSIEEWCNDPIAYYSRLSTGTLSVAQIEADVLEFHENSLRYAKNPIAKMVWKGKKDPYQLHPYPEQRIQSYLHLYLRASYKHFRGIVDEESVGKGGRCDIKVTWPSPIGSPFQPYTTTMLELKVLCEAQGASNHRNWALSGITQANDYRLSNSEAVYACIFDARKDQTDQMPDLDKIAKEKNVQLRRYLMEAPLDTKMSTSITKVPKKAATKKSVTKRAKKAL
jgi:hypothetical protein